MQKHFGLIVILLPLLLAGCIPIVETYYRPYSPGSVEIARCNAPVKYISLDAGTGKLQFFAFGISHKPGFAFFAISFSQSGVWERSGTFTKFFKATAGNSTLTMNPDAIEIQIAKSETKTRPTLVRVSRYDQKQMKFIDDYPLTKPLVLALKSHDLHNGLPSDEYLVHFSFPIGDQKGFTVFLDDFRVDDIQQKARSIHFIEDTSFRISPINGC